MTFVPPEVATKAFVPPEVATTGAFVPPEAVGSTLAAPSPSTQPTPQGGFVEGFKESAGDVVGGYKTLFTEPSKTYEGVKQAFGALTSDNFSYADAASNLADSISTQFSENPSRFAGTVVGAIVDPLTWLGLGAGAVAKGLVKGGKALATAGGATAAGVAGGALGVTSAGMIAASKGKVLTGEEAAAALMMSAAPSAIGGSFLAKRVADKRVKAIIDGEEAAYLNDINAFQEKVIEHQKALEGVDSLEIDWSPIKGTIETTHGPMESPMAYVGPNESGKIVARVDYNRLIATHRQELWKNPPEGINPIDAEFNVGQWAEYVVQHERAHTYNPQMEGESFFDYENRINQASLKAMKEKTYADPEMQVLKDKINARMDQAKVNNAGMLTSVFTKNNQIQGYLKTVEAQYGYIPKPARDYVTNVAETILQRAASATPTSVKKAGAIIGEGVGAVTELTKELVGQSANRLKDIADRAGSTAAMRLYEDIAGAGSVRGFQHHVDIAAGSLKDPILFATKDLKRSKILGTLDPEESARIIKEVTDPRVKKSPEAIIIKRMLDKAFYKAEAAGVLIKRVANFFPRKYNTLILRSEAGGDKFVELLMRYGWKEKRARSILNNIISRDGEINFPEVEITPLTLDGSGKVQVSGAAPKGTPKSTKARPLAKIPDFELEEFLTRDSDATRTLLKYMDEITRHTEYVRRFGANNEHLNDLVVDIIRETKASGKPITQKQVDNIYHLADALMRRQKPLDIENNSWDKVIGGLNSVFVPFNHLVLLPLTTIASAPEIVIPLAKVANRPSAYLKGLAKGTGHVVRSMIGVKKLFKEQGLEYDATRAISEIDIGLDAGMRHITEDFMANESSLGATISSGFFRLTLLNGYTKTMMVIANETGKAMVQGHLKDIVAKRGNIIKYRKDLIALGVDVEGGLKWVREGASVDHPYYKDQIVGAGLHFTRQTVMMPNPSSLPLFHTNPRFRLVAQLKSFPTMFGNTVLMDWAKIATKGDNKQKMFLTATVISSAMLGMASVAMSDYIRYGEEGNPRHKNMTPTEKFLQGLEKAGGFAMGSVVIDAYNSPTFGSSPATVVLGPTASLFEKGFKTTQRKDVPKALAKFASRNIPLLNINKEVRTNVADMLEKSFKD